MTTRIVKSYHGRADSAFGATLGTTRTILLQAEKLQRSGMKYLIHGGILLVEMTGLRKTPTRRPLRP